MDYKVYIGGIVEKITANSTLEAAHHVLSIHGLVSARSIAVRNYHQTIEYRDCMVIDDTLEYLGSSVIDKIEIDWTGLTLREEQYSMKCKVFSTRTRKDLEETINKWLKTHHISFDTMRFKYGAVYCDDPVEHIIEHTLVLFYVPTGLDEEE